MHNLRANPRAHIVFRGYAGAVNARELAGEERAATWARLLEFNPQYSVYQAGTARTLPVILLQRTAG